MPGGRLALDAAFPGRLDCGKACSPIPLRAPRRRCEPARPAPDPVVEAYKRDVDRTLLRQNLRRSVTERVENLIALQALAAEARRAGRVRERDG